MTSDGSKIERVHLEARKRFLGLYCLFLNQNELLTGRFNHHNAIKNVSNTRFFYKAKLRLVPVLKTIFHQCVISYSCSQSNSNGSVLELSELDWLQVYKMTN